MTDAYDSRTNTWTTEAPLPTPRDGLSAGVIGNELYAPGGYTSIRTSDIVDAYDSASRTWAKKKPMPHPRVAFRAGVAGGALYVVDGCCNGNHHEARTLWAFNP